jgi:signal transduction histidine kinase
MGDLIDALLQLSRVSRTPMQRAPVDVAAVASRVIADLRTEAPRREEVAVTIERSLFVEGDPRLVEVVLDNLLRNAWKFTSKKERPSIAVGRVRRDGEEWLFVRDNGAGFAPEHASRLFGPFQRLHRETDFDGTGIGLATVQRIISRHGGRIWAEAAPDQGATFFFTFGQRRRAAATRTCGTPSA